MIREWLNGKKTYIAGFAAIFAGLGQIFAALNAEYFDPQEVWTGLTVIAGGLGMMGFRHALEKKKE